MTMAQQTYGEYMRSNPPIPTLTAVEWFDRWFRDNPEATHEEGNKALQQAKQMEKEQIVKAFGVGCQVESTRLIGYHGMAEQYYNETYNQ